MMNEILSQAISEVCHSLAAGCKMSAGSAQSTQVTNCKCQCQRKFKGRVPKCSKWDLKEVAEDGCDDSLVTPEMMWCDRPHEDWSSGQRTCLGFRSAWPCITMNQNYRELPLSIKVIDKWEIKAMMKRLEQISMQQSDVDPSGVWTPKDTNHLPSFGPHTQDPTQRNHARASITGNIGISPVMYSTLTEAMEPWKTNCCPQHNKGSTAHQTAIPQNLQQFSGYINTKKRPR